jgi:hypothetical protein
MFRFARQALGLLPDCTFTQQMLDQALKSLYRGGFESAMSDVLSAAVMLAERVQDAGAASVSRMHTDGPSMVCVGTGCVLSRTQWHMCSIPRLSTPPHSFVKHLIFPL